MQNLHGVIDHLKAVSADFYGEIRIRVRDGEAVLLESERSYKLTKDRAADSPEQEGGLAHDER